MAESEEGRQSLITVEQEIMSETWPVPCGRSGIQIADGGHIYRHIMIERVTRFFRTVVLTRGRPVRLHLASSVLSARGSCATPASLRIDRGIVALGLPGITWRR